MNISYEAIGHLAVTMPAGNCTVGYLCEIDTAGKVKNCSLNGIPIGRIQAVDNGMAAVQVDGFVKQGYSGAAPTCGYVGLTGNGKGGVMVNENAKAFLVVAVDTVNQTVQFKL